MSPLDLSDLIRRYRVALTILGALALAGGSWIVASAYASPHTTYDVERRGEWTERAQFTYSVPVTRNSTHWPIGTTLPMGEPAYFRTISDGFHVNFTWAADAPDPRGVAAARIAVEVRAQTEDGRPFWSIDHTLAEANTQDVTAGLALHGWLDLDALYHEVITVSEELPMGDGVVNWSIVAHVVRAIETDGATVIGEQTFVMPIEANEPRYVLPGAQALTWKTLHAEETATPHIEVAGWSGVVRAVRGLGLLVVGAALLLAGGIASARGPRGTDGFEREYRRHRDWVSVAGTLPEAARRSESIVEVGSLEDLVHVAADARTRVLLDAQERVFYALLPGVTYRYGRHAAPS